MYIDDADNLKVRGTISGLEAEGELNITHDQPTGVWETQLTPFLDSSFKEDYQGIILDLRLDDFNSSKSPLSKYKGTSLAQELRTLMKEKRLSEIPIVLLSAEHNLKESFDLTGNDLFDIVQSKEHLQPMNFRNELVALAEGYERLRDEISPTKISAISNILNKNIEDIDVRFVAKLQSLLQSPIHQIASFLIRHLIGKNGILISESLLAARLGIDLENSTHWNDLLIHLDDFSYKGVFDSGWKRWWMHDIDTWWTKVYNSKLRQLSASDRVKILIESTKLSNIRAATPFQMARSDKFWSVCSGSNIPIDTIDGLLVSNQDHLYPWQDREYVSFYEAVNRTNVEKWKDVSPLEKVKLEQIKSLYSRDRIPRP